MPTPPLDPRERIAWRAAQELKDGDYVNLGIGLPTLAANYLPKNTNVILHTENGMLGYGAYPIEGEEDADLINAGKETISEIPGCSYFDSSTSFSMVRGGHLDVTILGALQVSEEGDLANWIIPGKAIKGMGGAMDMVTGTKKIIITMEHVAKNGEPKILKKCSYPLTGKRIVDLIVTDLAVIRVTPKGLVLEELAPGVTLEQVQKATEPKLILGSQLKNPALV